MDHVHLALQLTFDGHIMAPRASHHPDLLARAADIRDCAICGNTCYIHRKTMNYLSVYPAKLVLCCTCSESADKMITDALPGSAVLAMPVPDLAAGGVFN